jgi:hypothetical protein
MCSETALVETDTSDPLIHKAGILAGRHGAAVVTTSRKEEFSRPCSAGPQL